MIKKRNSKKVWIGISNKFNLENLSRYLDTHNLYYKLGKKLGVQTVVEIYLTIDELSGLLKFVKSEKIYEGNQLFKG